MTTLYITEPGAYLTSKNNRLEIKKSQDLLKSLPIEKIENVVMVGSVSVSGPCMTDLLEREVPLTWISYNGKMFGRLEPTTGINIERQREQFRRGEDPAFSLAIAKKFVSAKIRNSRVLLARWNRERNIPEVPGLLEDLKIAELYVEDASDIPTLMGYEGHASKVYFKGMGMVVPSEFAFQRRSKQPPKDPFNAMLSLAYTLLMYECYTALKTKGLHPYMAYLHQIRQGHPALASDMMEEWRSVICDSVVMDLVTHHKVNPEDFIDSTQELGGIYCTGDASKRLIEAFEKKLKVMNQYVTFVDYPLSFRESLQFQVGALVKAIENNDPEIYKPVTIR
ncbi:MAG: CRISPR-associated endonuclease Cas1 [Cyanobacteria bacterium]|nr:CRISPR-associated endonuclease Cas1 [Cyanobacteriota bacterium]